MVICNLNNSTFSVPKTLSFYFRTNQPFEVSVLKIPSCYLLLTVRKKYIF